MKSGSEAKAPSDRELCWKLAALFACLTAAKLIIAANLDLFWDEAYYWQAAQRLDVGYADKPFVTALLVRIGTFIAGDTRIGVRAIYLAIGAVFPAAMYLLARPVVGPRDALLAAGLSLVLPITALLGVLAFQDMPMLLFGVLAMAAFERARRTDVMGWWLLAGSMCALGFSTHYRFVPLLLAFLVYLIMTRHGRTLWTRKGLWLAIAVTGLGLLPILIFNLKVDFASLRFQVIDRNPWAFQIKGLRYPLEQALAVTPLLFVAMMATLVDAFRRARKGDDNASYLAICSAVYLGFYFLLSPWADREHFNAHWPATGYLPLLVLLPDALRRFARSGRTRRALAALVPASAGVAVLGILFYLMAAIWPATLFPDFLYRHLRHELVGWSRLAPKVSELLDTHYPDGGDVVLIGGHYRVASALDFAIQPADTVYVLDHRQNRMDGYWFQFVLWGMDEASLRRDRAGEPALIAVEDSHFWFSSHREVAWRARLCTIFDELRHLEDFELTAGRRNFLFYAGRVRGLDTPPRDQDLGPGNCPTLPSAYLAQPKRGSSVEGSLILYGWAVDDRVGVRSVEMLLDGKAIGPATYGNYAPRVRELMPGSTDPNHPNVGFHFEWDSGVTAPGRHKLSFRVVSNDGNEREFGSRTVFVRSPD